MNLDVSEEATTIRQVMLMAEMIRSHCFNVFFMTLPDLFAMTSQLANKDLLGISHVKPAIAEMTRELLWCSEKILEILGGRSVHPISSIVGGISKPVSRESQEELLRTVKNSTKSSRSVTDLVHELIKAAGNQYELFNVRDNVEYVTCLDPSPGRAFYGGSLKTFNSMTRRWTRANAAEMISRHRSGKYRTGNQHLLTGPMARSATAQDSHQTRTNTEAELNLLAINSLRAEEMAHSIMRSIELLENQDLSRTPTRTNIGNLSGAGYGAVEAPRGTLIHYYEFRRARVTAARILTPTEINAACISDCVNQVASRCSDAGLLMDDVLDKAKASVRLLDPCVSCVTHTRIAHV